ncbi:MAG: hypothetical protein FWC70_01635 [Defluviitaleaceae bacterium]|nr:hypothetical protein [Defluviitaleaceae bacterium]
MPDQVKRYTDPVKARWDLLTPPQRYKLLAVIAVVLIAIAVTLFFAFRTPWTVLATRQDMTAIGPMRAALDDAGIRNEVIDNGRGIRVDSRRIDDAQVVLHMQGAIPHDENFTWANALDTGLGTTDDERRLRYVRATEGAIERQLYSINGITGAQVGLAIPQQRPFDLNAPQPSASVTLTTSQEFSRQQGRDIALLVARRVSQLPIENIMIIDQHARTIWNGADDVNDDPMGTAFELRERHRDVAIMGAKQVLSHAFNDVSVAFIPVFDEQITREEVRTERRVPDGMDGGGIPIRDTGERSEMRGGGTGFEPGLASSTATFPNYAMPGSGDMEASQRIWDTHFAVDEIVTATLTGPGGIDLDASRASVLVVRDRMVYQDIWMNQTPEGEDARNQLDWEIFKNENAVPMMMNGDYFAHFHSLAANAIGLPMERVDFLVIERLVPVDTAVRAWGNYIPTIFMVAVFLLLLAMLLYSLLRRHGADGEDEDALEPQLAVEDLLVSTQLEEAKEEASQELEEIDYFKENEIKKHIEKFVNEKPEAVAALLRNWINVEEW